MPQPGSACRPALSQGLSELERRIGVPLFDREGRRRTLRPTAEPVLAHARQVIALTSDLADWAERTRTGRAGELRVGMIDAAAVGHFTDVLRQFRDDHPELHLTLQVAPSGELLDEIESGDLDLAVVVGGHTRRGVHTESLMNEPLAVFTPTRGLPRDVAAWGRGVVRPGFPHSAIAEDALQRLGAPTSIVAESNQPEVLRTMVELGGLDRAAGRPSRTGLRPGTSDRRTNPRPCPPRRRRRRPGCRNARRRRN